MRIQADFPRGKIDAQRGYGRRRQDGKSDAELAGRDQDAAAVLSLHGADEAKQAQRGEQRKEDGPNRADRRRACLRRARGRAVAQRAEQKAERGIIQKSSLRRGVAGGERRREQGEREHRGVAKDDRHGQPMLQNAAVVQAEDPFGGRRLFLRRGLRGGFGGILPLGLRVARKQKVGARAEDRGQLRQHPDIGQAVPVFPLADRLGRNIQFFGKVDLPQAAVPAQEREPFSECHGFSLLSVCSP